MPLFVVEKIILLKVGTKFNIFQEFSRMVQNLVFLQEVQIFWKFFLSGV